MSAAEIQFFCGLAALFKTAISPSDVPLRLRAAFHFFHHPRNKLVCKLPFKGFTLTGGVGVGRSHLDGLTAQLETVFYPFSARKSTGGARSGGASRGNQVGAEIDRLVNQGLVPGGSGPSSAATLAGAHKYTLKTLQYLKDHQLQPFAAEMIVYDEKIGIATPIDIVCVDLACKDLQRNIVMVELKTGFDLNYEAADGFFHSPFVKDSLLLTTTDSHKNKHQLQALVEHMLVTKNYGDFVRETRVLVISENIHSSYGLSKHIRGLAHHVYLNLYRRLQARQADPDYGINLRHAAEKKGQSAARMRKWAA